MSFTLQNQVMKVLPYSGNYLRTAQAMAGYANRDGENIFVKDETLAEQLNVHKDTIGRHRRKFIKDGYLVQTGTRGYHNRVKVYKLILDPPKPEPEETPKDTESVGNFWGAFLAKINDDLKHHTNDSNPQLKHDTFAVKHGNSTIRNTTLLLLKHDTFSAPYNKVLEQRYRSNKNDQEKESSCTSNINTADTQPDQTPIDDDFDIQKTDDSNSEIDFRDIKPDGRHMSVGKCWDACMTQLHLSGFDEITLSKYTLIGWYDHTYTILIPGEHWQRNERPIRRVLSSIAGTNVTIAWDIKPPEQVVRLVREKESSQKVPPKRVPTPEPKLRIVEDEPAEMDITREVELYAFVRRLPRNHVPDWEQAELREAVKTHGRQTVLQRLEQVKRAGTVVNSWNYFQTTFTRINKPKPAMVLG